MLPTNVMSILVPMAGAADSLFDLYQPLSALQSTLNQTMSESQS